MPDEQENEKQLSDMDRTKCIKNLRNLMLEDDQLKNLQSDDQYLERFLIALDFDVEAAFQRMKEFYDVLVEFPEWFAIDGPSVKKSVIEQDVRILLKDNDKEGRPIYIVKLANINPSTMTLLEDMVPVDDYYVETILQENTGIKNGLCVIIDIGGFPFNLMKWLTPYNIKTVLKRIQSMPIKEFRYHVVNNSFLVNTAIKILWPFLPEKIKNSVKFHFNDFEALHQHIDKDVLPEEYGGKQKIDYCELREPIFNKNEDIMENFKLNRFMYLEAINCNNKD